MAVATVNYRLKSTSGLTLDHLPKWPDWLNTLWGRLQEQSGESLSRIQYADRNQLSMNTSRTQIVAYYETILTDVSGILQKLVQERDGARVHAEGETREKDRNQTLAREAHSELRNLRAEYEAVLDLIARAYTGERRVADFEDMYGVHT